MNLSYTLILPISKLQTQQGMTSQIRSHIEYFIQTYIVKIDEKNNLNDCFNTI